MSAAKPHLVVIGNGMAGFRAVEEILARDPVVGVDHETKQVQEKVRQDYQL